jgi:hypothetical protein
MVETCEDERTTARLKAFQGYLAGKDGDLLCPVPAR